MDEYQLGFTHACRLIKVELENQKIPKNVIDIMEFVEQEEIKAIKKGIGF